MSDDLASAPLSGNSTVFLTGPSGAGKTTQGVERLLRLLREGIPAEQVLVLVPQRTLARPYYEALESAQVPPGGQVDVATVGGLARRTLDLFWPLVAEGAGFAQPSRRPRFLTLETAQYLMNRLLEPFLAVGAFDGITISRSRLVSQIIDNLNKSSAVGFPANEIAERLKSAWAGESARLRIYDQVETAALAFRRACLSESLLDWSLQIEVFRKHLMPLPQLRRYLLGGYRHLIVDNVEEDIPACHDLLRQWLPLCESALVIHDTEAGYRVFLGADPEGAYALRDACRDYVAMAGSHVSTAAVASLGQQLAAPLSPTAPPPRPSAREALVLPTVALRFHPQMLDWVADQISRLVMEEGLPPGEIAVLAPFLSDALRFSLTERLDRYGIAVRSHRPSRQLREEPAARCLLTLACLAHPGWRRPPPLVDVAHALGLAVEGLDPVRARLLAEIVYRVAGDQPQLTPFHELVPETQERVSFALGSRYEELRRWLADSALQSGSGPPENLDHFLSGLFGAVLSQAGFGFHHNYDAGAVAATLIESIRKFRQSCPELLADQASVDLGLEYLDMVERGVIAAQYVSTWEIRPENAVLLLPAYTFLMMNRPATVQFWLDAGSLAWHERIYQPLTHPHVLRRGWDRERVWTDDDEVQARRDALARLVLGLCRRCRRRVYLAYSELNERGYEQQGPLLLAVQHALRGREEPQRG